MMEISCYRHPEVSHELRQLPAATYNLAITLLARSASGNLFIPIRAMQFLAILDADELIFLDGERKCWVDIAWHNFRPQLRNALNEPVAFEAVYYHDQAYHLMSRLQAELPKALHALAQKSQIDGPARVLKFRAP